MLAGEPNPTPYDLNFSMFGFPVRISIWFWVGAAVIVGQGPLGGPALVAGILAILVSILIHELGHTFAFRHFGISSRIVLYHFGGIAIPDAFGSPWRIRSSGSGDPFSQIVIAAMGPLVQLISGLLVVLLLRLSNYEATLGFRVVDEWLRLAEGNPLPSRELMLFVDVYLFVSVYWALLNLLPVYPLDGGQISRNLFLIYSRSSAVQQSLSLSMWTAIAVAIYGFTNGRMFLGIMFAMLAHSSYQTMQAYTGRGGGFGSPW